MTQLHTLLQRYLWPHRLRFAWMAGLMLGGIGLQVLGPQYMRDVIDGAKSDVHLDRLTLWAGAYFGIMLAAEFVRQISAYITEDVGWRATNSLRVDLSRQCLEQDMEFHASHPPGELIERVDGDVGRLAKFLSSFTLDVVRSLVTLMGVLVVLFLEGPLVGGSMSGLAAVVLLLLFLIRGFARPYWTTMQQEMAAMYSYLEERLAGREDLRANGASTYAVNLFRQRMLTAMRAGVRAVTRADVGANMAWMLFGFSEIVALAMGLHMYGRQQITIGTVYLIMHYVAMVFWPLGRMVHQVDTLQRVQASVDRISDLLDTTVSVDAGRDRQLPPSALSVDLQDVTFAYRPGVTVLHDVNLTLPPGRRLGLIGRTGSGKTTITRLLQSLVRTDSGHVHLAGMDVDRLQLDSLRAGVASVTQDVQLFAGTVRDNVTLFDESIADPAILDAIQQLGLNAWFERLPDGLDTVLPSGGGLSAGEAQLLAFTRVLLRDPGLVILDEASSRLDPATEALLETAIEGLLTGRTAVVIAHRLATLDHVDDVLLLEEGRVVESGERRRLAADSSSRYARLRAAGMEDVLQ